MTFDEKKDDAMTTTTTNAKRANHSSSSTTTTQNDDRNRAKSLPWWPNLWILIIYFVAAFAASSDEELSFREFLLAEGLRDAFVAPLVAQAVAFFCAFVTATVCAKATLSVPKLTAPQESILKCLRWGLFLAAGCVGLTVGRALSSEPANARHRAFILLFETTAGVLEGVGYAVNCLEEQTSTADHGTKGTVATASEACGSVEGDAAENDSHDTVNHQPQHRPSQPQCPQQIKVPRKLRKRAAILRAVENVPEDGDEIVNT
jgi:hypothetical protein